MKNLDHLTEGHEPILARQIRLSKPGMAHFAAGGPAGTTCSQCALWGYWRQVKNAAGDTVGTKFRRGCCAKYYAMTGKHGAPVPLFTESCRYFERREQSR